MKRNQQKRGQRSSRKTEWWCKSEERGQELLVPEKLWVWIDGNEQVILKVSLRRGILIWDSEHRMGLACEGDEGLAL